MLKLHVTRLNHLEKLLAAIATLAIAGWGYFLTSFTQPESFADQSVSLGRPFFAIVFSGLVGSTFNSLYIGRMGVNLSLLQLEQYLAPDIRPYRAFIATGGVFSCLIIFAVPAFFMPLLAIGAIGLTAREALNALGKGAELSGVLLYALAVTSATPVTFTTLKSLGKVWEVLGHTFVLTPEASLGRSEAVAPANTTDSPSGAQTVRDEPFPHR
jgi:hypothetical protein